MLIFSNTRELLPADFIESTLHRVLKRPFLLGLFLPLQNGDWSPSKLARTTDWQFEYNKQLTIDAEKLGFDLVFGLAEWNHKGGVWWRYPLP